MARHRGTPAKAEPALPTVVDLFLGPPWTVARVYTPMRIASPLQICPFESGRSRRAIQSANNPPRRCGSAVSIDETIALRLLSRAAPQAQRGLPSARVAVKWRA